MLRGWQRHKNKQAMIVDKIVEACTNLQARGKSLSCTGTNFQGPSKSFCGSRAGNNVANGCWIDQLMGRAEADGCPAGTGGIPPSKTSNAHRLGAPRA
jgi:hypothetical protein